MVHTLAAYRWGSVLMAFAAYYNEARVLDEKTFATVKVLPNMPGNVNNFLAGRTYPMEGAAVMLPQVARTSPARLFIQALADAESS